VLPLQHPFYDRNFFIHITQNVYVCLYQFLTPRIFYTYNSECLCMFISIFNSKKIFIHITQNVISIFNSKKFFIHITQNVYVCLYQFLTPRKFFIHITQNVYVCLYKFLTPTKKKKFIHITQNVYICLYQFLTPTTPWFCSEFVLASLLSRQLLRLFFKNVGKFCAEMKNV
jgi:hypothetical protein